MQLILMLEIWNRFSSSILLIWLKLKEPNLIGSNLKLFNSKPASNPFKSGFFDLDSLIWKSVKIDLEFVGVSMFNDSKFFLFYFFFLPSPWPVQEFGLLHLSLLPIGQWTLLLSTCEYIFFYVFLESLR